MKTPVLMYLAGIYGNANKTNDSKVHVSSVWREPLCGTQHWRDDESEYVFSDFKYDLEVWFIGREINPEVITCKKCLKAMERYPIILAKAGGVLWIEDKK